MQGFFEDVKNEVNDFEKWLNENLINSKLILKKGINIDELKQEYVNLIETFKIYLDNFNEKISICKEKIAEQINCIENNLKEVDESFKNLNMDLVNLGFNDIKFEKISDTHYKTQRQDCNGSWLDCKSGLSEGEKTIISLIYFINSYLATSQDLEEYPILIIDDPITSLDNTNKDKIINYILNKIVKNENIRSQIFILSHEKYILHKIDKKLNRKNFSKKKILNVSKHKFTSKIYTLDKILLDNEIREIYNKLKKYVDNPELNIENSIMEFPRRLLEKMFSIICENDANFTDCYKEFFERYKMEQLYSPEDIQELNHNKSDEDLSPETLEKCKFVLKMSEKFTNPYKNTP